MAKTPMMRQYAEAKSACADALLLFRMGDFYELFHDDAKVAARELGLTLTSREKGENPIPMAGFPHHQLENYLGKLVAAGFRAAICDQVEDPKQAKGLVKREVTRVVTPGTLTDDALLDPRESNYLAAVVAVSSNAKAAKTAEVGVAWAELSTGRFQAAVFPLHRLADQLARISPAECLLSDGDPPLESASHNGMALTVRPEWEFSLQSAEDALTKHFSTASLEGFGFAEEDGAAIRAAGAVLGYLQETQRTSLDHIDRLVPYHDGQALEIDQATRRSLELTRTLRDGRREGSLLAVLDRAVTPMGSRMLADWMSSPLVEIQAIESRLDAVAELMDAEALRERQREQLKSVYDLQRLLARITTGRATPRDLSFISRTLGMLPEVKQALAGCQCDLLRQLHAEVDLCEELRQSLDDALVDDCPLNAREGGVVREGYHETLDELRELAAGGKEWIAQYQAEESERTGIASLKVGFNKVFGYYLEVTNTHRAEVPETYIRKQTLKNAERYITPKLKEYEEQVLSADERAKSLEYDLFVQLRDAVHTEVRRLQLTAVALARLDVLLALAELARQRGYCRPQLVLEPVLRIEEGRHPVLDIIEPEGTFVPNDTLAGQDEGNVLLITGPNMAGKSTYIRQVALISLMAQLGSFVPARRAVIGVADRIFARVGASDELSRGQSTFMVEMTETARILNNASVRSLVILDEIGRGTSTYDGISLAWAIVEHIHDGIGCRTLFATHYHELTELEGLLPGVSNLNVAVKEWEENVVFLHKIVGGSADKSYGIHVARLAGVPREVNERAKQILTQLESENLDAQGRPRVGRTGQGRSRQDLQLSLFAPPENPLLEEIRQLDVNRLTPLEALQQIDAWRQKLLDQ